MVAPTHHTTWLLADLLKNKRPHSGVWMAGTFPRQIWSDHAPSSAHSSYSLCEKFLEFEHWQGLLAELRERNSINFCFLENTVKMIPKFKGSPSPKPQWHCHVSHVSALWSITPNSLAKNGGIPLRLRSFTLGGFADWWTINALSLFVENT